MGAFYKLLHSGTLLIHSRRVSYPLRRGLRSWKYRIADAVVGVSREIADGMIGRHPRLTGQRDPFRNRSFPLPPS